MSKKTPEHFDRIGRQVEVGDVVAVADFNGIMIAKVTKLNSKMIKIKRHPSTGRSSERNKYSKDAIKLDPEDVAIYILQGGD
jgi:hypothetical protein